MAIDTWEAKFPHPGAAPATPASPSDFTATQTYNAWVTNMRKHNVAKAVDTLIAAEAGGVPLNAVETIALTLGLMLLDGSIKETAPGLFGMLF